MAHINEKYIFHQAVVSKGRPFLIQVNYWDGTLSQYASSKYETANKLLGKVVAIFKPKCNKNEAVKSN